MAGLFALVVWLVVDAVRDLSSARRHHVGLDIARILAAVAVIGFTAGVAVLTTGGPASTRRPSPSCWPGPSAGAWWWRPPTSRSTTWARGREWAARQDRLCSDLTLVRFGAA